MVTRAEASVMLNADVGTIERNLGIGKSYFDRWGKQLKTDQEKYTEWWGMELKKREEMEVAASVRAAQRSNLARKLKRDRTETTAARIAEDIGQGSIPESWKKVSGAGTQAAHELEGAFTHFKHHAGHEIHGAAEIIKTTFGGQIKEISGLLKGFAFGYVTVIAFAAIEGWKKFTEFLAEKTYGNDSASGELLANLLDQRREAFRQIREERAAAHEEYMKQSAEEAKQAQERVKLDEDLTDAIMATRQAQQGGDETEAGRNTHHDRLEFAKNLRLEELEAAKLHGTRADQMKAEIALQHANLELVQFQTEEQRRQNALKKEAADTERERQQILQGELTKYMPTLDELSHRGAFRSQARQIGRLDRQIKRDFEFGNVGKAQSDLATRDRMYDSLAGKGILPEREEKRRMDELTRKTAEHIADIAQGNKRIKVKAEIE